VLAEDRGVAYLDPPYLVTLAKRRYALDFSVRDHLDLADALEARRSPWLLSYDDDVRVRGLYEGCDIRGFRHGRGLGGERRFFRELLIRPAPGGTGTGASRSGPPEAGES